MSESAKVYRITAMNDTKGVVLAYACGDVRAMQYHARGLVAAMQDAGDGQEFTVKLTETAGINGDDTRTVASITGDVDVCGYVLGKKLRSERAAAPEPAAAE